jgi:hypothetical protein
MGGGGEGVMSGKVGMSGINQVTVGSVYGGRREVTRQRPRPRPRPARARVANMKLLLLTTYSIAHSLY